MVYSIKLNRMDHSLYSLKCDQVHTEELGVKWRTRKEIHLFNKGQRRLEESSVWKNTFTKLDDFK